MRKVCPQARASDRCGTGRQALISPAWAGAVLRQNSARCRGARARGRLLATRTRWARAAVGWRAGDTSTLGSEQAGIGPGPYLRGVVDSEILISTQNATLLSISRPLSEVCQQTVTCCRPCSSSSLSLDFIMLKNSPCPYLFIISSSIFSERCKNFVFYSLFVFPWALFCYMLFVGKFKNRLQMRDIFLIRGSGLESKIIVYLQRCYCPITFFWWQQTVSKTVEERSPTGSSHSHLHTETWTLRKIFRQAGCA